MDIILQLLFLYKNKTISTLDFNLNQQFSNEKFKIKIDPNSSNYLRKDVEKYLINEFQKTDINIYVIKYLNEHGANINRIISDDGTSLNISCIIGNLTVVKF